MFARVQRIFVEELGLEDDEVTLEASLSDDLGCDSLDRMNLILEFEREFSVEIDDVQAEKFKTVGDVVSFLTATSSRTPSSS